MKTNEIEKQYNELKKKAKLPDFKEMDFEFEISDIEDTNFLLRMIIRKIAEKLDFYSTMLEELLQPDTSSLYALHETRYFDENDKRQMYELYTRLMSFNRQSIESALSRNEKKEAEFINDIFNEWKPLKESLLKFVRKMRESWNTKEVDIKEDLRYLG